MEVPIGRPLTESDQRQRVIKPLIVTAALEAASGGLFFLAFRRRGARVTARGRLAERRRRRRRPDPTPAFADAITRLRAAPSRVRRPREGGNLVKSFARYFAG
jgi:hypothetical protein